jgi:hypothetical protein
MREAPSSGNRRASPIGPATDYPENVALGIEELEDPAAPFLRWVKTFGRAFPLFLLVSGSFNFDTRRFASACGCSPTMMVKILRVFVATDLAIPYDHLRFDEHDVSDVLQRWTYSRAPDIPPIGTFTELESKHYVVVKRLLEFRSNEIVPRRPSQPRDRTIARYSLVHSESRIYGDDIERQLRDIGASMDFNLEALAICAHLRRNSLIRKGYLESVRAHVSQYIRTWQTTTGSPFQGRDPEEDDDGQTQQVDTDSLRPEQIAQLEIDVNQSPVCALLRSSYPKGFQMFSPFQKRILIACETGEGMRSIGRESTHWPEGSVALTSGPIHTAVVRALTGHSWHRGVDGGRQPALNPDEEDYMLRLIRVDGGDIQVQQFIDMVLAYRREALSRSHIQRAAEFLKHTADLEELQAVRQTETRCNAWCKWWARARNLKVTAGEQIETARWLYGTKVTVSRWFNNMKAVMTGVHDSMIFNFDEVMVAIGKSGRVISSLEQTVFRKKQAKLPHFTVGACFNRLGARPPMLIVIPQILQKTVDSSLKIYVESGRAQLVASAKGWVTERVFTEFAKQFCSWLETYRREKTERESSPAVLFIDNAPTHNAREAMDIFKAHNVMVITYPPHLTHVMQPVDVSWARAFKAAFTRWLHLLQKDNDFQLYWRQTGTPNDAQWLRSCVVAAAISAGDQASNIALCMNAFAQTGLAPTFDPARVLGSRYLRDADIDQEEIERAAKPNRLFMSSRILTSKEWEREMEVFHGRKISPAGTRDVPEEMEPEEAVVVEDADIPARIDDDFVEEMGYDAAWAADGRRPVVLDGTLLGQEINGGNHGYDDDDGFAQVFLGGESPVE